MLAAAVAALLPISGYAQTQISPPQFAACEPATPPELPSRWRAVGLMSPFFIGQIDVGEFVNDDAVPAMRATVYGLESGAVDLLITGADTYLLTGPHDGPTGCTSLGQKFKPPTQWLAANAICIGEAPVQKTELQWWSTPGPTDRAIWYWFRKKTRLPWRSVFLTHTANPAVIGDYAMTYFPTFTPLQETKLASLRDFCLKHAIKADAAAASARTARDLMAFPNEAADAERLRRIATLIPGLSHAACSGVKPVSWPDRFTTTLILTPQQFGHYPFSAIMYYDWSDTGTQIAGMYRGIPPRPHSVVILKKRIGYSLEHHKPGALACDPTYPGTVRPDWMTTAFCQCRGVIDHNPELSPDGIVRIFACPIKWQLNHLMWSWYTPKGDPVMFMEAAASKVGVMLADYESWFPGVAPPASFFNLPAECSAIGAIEGRLSDPSCSDCHTTPQ